MNTDRDDQTNPRTAGSDIVPAGSGTELAKPAGSERIKPGSDPEWFIPDRSVVKRPMDGVFLGAIPNADGWGSKYRDTSATPTPDGFTFIVEQSSAGMTGISAEATKGYSVEALSVDQETGLPMWKAPEAHAEGRVRVAGDWGQLVAENPPSYEKMMSENFGIPGGQIGVIRVTGPDGATRYLALGADFQGRDSTWQVTGRYAQIEPRNLEALSAMEDGSNRAKVLEAGQAVEAAKSQPRDDNDYYYDRLGRRVSPDPLAQERGRITDQAAKLLHDLKDAQLPILVEKGLVAEASSSWHRDRGVRCFVFTEPQLMADGRQATMELTVPADEDKPAFWGLKMKMAWDEGRRASDRGYTEAEIRSVPPNEQFPDGRIVVGGHQRSRGSGHSVSLDQRHENSMHSEVRATGTVVADAEKVIQKLVDQSSHL